MNFKRFISSLMVLACGSLFFAQAVVTEEAKNLGDSQQTETAALAQVQMTEAAANGAGSENNGIVENVAQSMDIFKDFYEYGKSLITPANIAKLIGAVIAFLIVFVIYKIIQFGYRKTAAAKLSDTTASLIERLIRYIFYIVVLMIILKLFGISLSAIWGAAGIAGVAIGFAAQTSVSNLISGLFVLTEKTMKHGDFIEVDGISGVIDEIGLLAIRIHTLDNQEIRIPNSTIINSKLINYSTNDYRRYVFDLGVDYGTDLAKAKEVLLTVPGKCPTVINNNPAYAPAAFPTTLGDSCINMSLVVWCKKEDFLATKEAVCFNVVKALNEAGINIPFNRMDVTLLTENTVPSISKK